MKWRPFFTSLTSSLSSHTCIISTFRLTGCFTVFWDFSLFIRRCFSAQSYPSSWPGPNSTAALRRVLVLQRSFLEQITKLQAFYSSCGLFWQFRDMKKSGLRTSPLLLEGRQVEKAGRMHFFLSSYLVCILDKTFSLTAVQRIVIPTDFAINIKGRTWLTVPFQCHSQVNCQKTLSFNH